MKFKTGTIIVLASFLTSLLAFEMVHAQDASDETQVGELIANPVVPNARLGEFQHGTYPSLGDNTHVGVDLVAACGSEVFPIIYGQVVDVISSPKKRNFKSLGYMVIISHPIKTIASPEESDNQRNFHSLYLHLQGPPQVEKGDYVKAGQTLIGYVGDTGVAEGCHTHFELRTFSKRFSKWKNIYGPGDQRNSKILKNGWADPVEWFNYYPDGLTYEIALQNTAMANALNLGHIGYNAEVESGVSTITLQNPEQLDLAMRLLKDSVDNVEFAEGSDHTILMTPFEVEQNLATANGSVSSGAAPLDRAAFFASQYYSTADPSTEEGVIEFLDSYFKSTSYSSLRLGDFVVLNKFREIMEKPRQGELNSDGLEKYQAWEMASVISIQVTKDLTTGKFTGWQDWNRAVLGAAKDVRIRPTSHGLNLSVTPQDPNWLIIPMGRFYIDQIIKNETLEITGFEYRLVMGTYSAFWQPEYLTVQNNLGVPLSEKRKFMALLKYDPFNSTWSVVASDYANQDSDFTTNNVRSRLPQ